MEKNIQIVSVPISALKPATYNPRTWSKDQLAQLTESIKRFGCVDPIIVNGAPERKDVVIGGHMRLMALSKLAYKEVPVGDSSMLATLPINQTNCMERKVEIIHNQGTDGVVVHVDEYEFTISGTEWATRRASNNFDLSSPNVSYTLTAEDITEIERYL